MKQTTLYATLLSLVVAIPATASNLLVDPGFEGAITTDGPPFIGFWEGFSGDGANVNPESTFAPTDPFDGSQHLSLTIDNAPNSFAGTFQDVAVIAGQTVTYSGWHKLASGNDGGGELRIEWRDSVSDTEVSRTGNFVPTYTSDYASFSNDYVVPAGADTARVVYAIQSFGGVADQQVFVDNLSITAIPEPTSLVMFVLAGAGLLASRRRS